MRVHAFVLAALATTAANLSANSYQRPGYTFTGCNTAEDGTGTPYGAGANFDFATDLTLYAQWELTETGGGQGGSESLTNTGADSSALTALASAFALAVTVAVATRVSRRRV